MLKKLLSIPLLILVGSAIIISSCGDDDDDNNNTPQNILSPIEESANKPAPAFNRTNFMTGLDNPWDLVFTENGTLFFTEQCRGLSVRKEDGIVLHVFGAPGAAMVANDLVCEGQSGALGVTLDPNYNANRTIYIYMSSNLSNPKTNRVVRLVLNSDITGISERTDIVTDIAYKSSGNAWGASGAHSGGRLKFGPDGFLYITTGDNHNGSIPQNLNSLGGKVLRVNRDGAAATENHLPTEGDSRIFTYGHRNIQGISFHPNSQQVYICEHGPNHSDEVTALTAGGNGGWDPKPDEGVACLDNYCGYGSNRTDGKPTSMTDLDKFPNALRPAYVWSESQGVGPCTFITGSQWEGWENALLVGVMASRDVDVLHISDGGELIKASNANLPEARVRSIAQGPNGDIFMALDSGTIWRLTPQEAEEEPAPQPPE